jgi:hypothetical protein
VPYFRLDQHEVQFILGLEKLTRETGVTLATCGVRRVENEESRDDPRAGYSFGNNDEIRWIDPENEDDWIDYSHTIVRPT